MKKFVLFLIIFFFTFNAVGNDRKNELNRLFIELKKDIINSSSSIEKQIWNIWSTHPTNQKLTSMLEEGSQLVQDQKLNKAILIFTKTINADPTWAEAWNKRATVYYMLGEFQKSQKDINKVLELEDRHFGALAGQGLVNIQLKNYEKAIRSYQMAKEIYPAMRSPKIMIKQIQDIIKSQSI